MTDQPESPLTPTAAGAHQMHEQFAAYIAAGFSRPEALEIVKTILTATIGRPPKQ